ncbi:hypothetical protein GYMLUDRAFT_68421 [Collybiopsis luxurians FD-317 M1]|nr:hypothetical protein GYMLUDRAFT_68421 [Collybiopsis luxurians FD-317 M1]
MILVHKQQFPLSTSFAHHKRHPSAPPAVVVQPTKVPGLLSLSKPIQRQQPRQRPSPKPKQVQPTRSPRATPIPEPSVLKPSPEILVKKSPADKSNRGRQHSKPKEKTTTRSSSHSAVRGRRNNARQPSPPISTSQAEVPPSPTHKLNLFDPFLDDSNVHSKPSKPASIPTLASRPSGKLARRRQPNLVPSNPPSKAIPVPRSYQPSASNLSKSEPGAIHIRPRKVASKASRDVFPICDDLSDSDESEDDSTPPATPTRSRPAPRFTLSFDDGPRTAPITASPSAFPFAVSSTPSPAGKKNKRKHARSPSEGVFAMSSDEEPANYRAHPNDIKALFGLTAKRMPLSDESELERDAAAAAAYFASSNFQNSPSPEELPPPSFTFL